MNPEILRTVISVGSYLFVAVLMLVMIDRWIRALIRRIDPSNPPKKDRDKGKDPDK